MSCRAHTTSGGRSKSAPGRRRGSAAAPGIRPVATLLALSAPAWAKRSESICDGELGEGRSGLLVLAGEDVTEGLRCLFADRGVRVGLTDMAQDGDG